MEGGTEEPRDLIILGTVNYLPGKVGRIADDRV
jgi:hypothetical protein